jgi:hypothetical protein
VESLVFYDFDCPCTGTLFLTTHSGGLLSNRQDIPGTFSVAINLLKSFGFLTGDAQGAKVSGYLLVFVFALALKPL